MANSDPSVGDVIYWEWLARCGQESRKDVVIVIRDGDYGRIAINDWLAQEFREKVGRSRNVHLTGMLSEVFGMATGKITRDEARKEEEMVRAMGEEAA